MGCCWSVPSIDRSDLKLIRQLGRGGQGSAFEAIYGERSVCVKQFGRVEFQPTEVDLQRIRRLKHKNIVRLIGVSRTPDFRMVTELCKSSLFDLLNRSNLISYQNLIDWSRECAEGMKYIHSKKMVHRDLKSLNVLIGYDGVLKINDFDFSRSIAAYDDYMNTFCGTLYWMAPELLTSRKYTYKVDVWSYGVLLWEIIAQQSPYNRVKGNDVRVGVPNGLIALPMPNGIPEKLTNLLKGCLTINPKERLDFKQVIQILSDLPEVNEPSWQRLKLEWRRTHFIFYTNSAFV